MDVTDRVIRQKTVVATAIAVMGFSADIGLYNEWNDEYHN